MRRRRTVMAAATPIAARPTKAMVGEVTDDGQRLECPERPVLAVESAGALSVGDGQRPVDGVAPMSVTN